MNNLKKILAVILVVLAVAGLAGCSAAPKALDAQWGYKTDTEEYPIGVHIYSLFSAYNQAYSIIKEAQGDKFDESASILDIESTFDEAGETVLCRDWIKQEADLITKNLIALDKEIEKYGIELDEEILASALAQAKNDWYLGSYYEEYLSYGYSATPYKDMLEPYGVSFDSFYISSYLASVKQNALFDYMYSEGGIKEVTAAEKTKYFEENYTSYSYFTVNLCEATNDESGNSTTVALPDAKVNEIKTKLNGYVLVINEDNGKFSDIAKDYQKYADLENDPTVSNIENLDNTSLGKEIADVLKALPEGKTGVVYVGGSDNLMAYVLYKHPIKDETKEYFAEETNGTSILQAMKGEEFLEYVDGLTDSVACEINEKVIAKYDPVMFEDIL